MGWALVWLLSWCTCQQAGRGWDKCACPTSPEHEPIREVAGAFSAGYHSGHVLPYCLQRATISLLLTSHSGDSAIKARIETLCPEGSYDLATTHAAAEAPAGILTQE